MLDHNSVLISEKDTLVAGLLRIARGSTYEADPELTSEHSMGNYDDVFWDGYSQAEYNAANLARAILAKVGIDYKVG